MKKLSIFEYKDYKKFILDWMDNTPNQGRGQRKLLAEAIGCQTPFITHVLSGDYHLSLEQADACARYLELNELDTEYFILLIQRQRAGTKSLEFFFTKQIAKLIEQNTILKNRVKIKDSMNIEDQMTYYSSWHYPSIHMALLIPELQNIQALTKYFNLPSARIIAVLKFLEEHQLIEKKNGIFRVKKNMLHLELHSPFLTQHHSLWRQKAIDSIQSGKLENLHYSGVMSLSKDDYDWVREKLSTLLEEVVVRIGTSKDEKLASLCFDLFQI
jgi:uncharacterized protein (TIGR02147 family)